MTGKKGRRAGVGAGGGKQRGGKLKVARRANANQSRTAKVDRAPARVGRSDNPKTERKADAERGRCATQRRIGSLV